MSRERGKLEALLQTYKNPKCRTRVDSAVQTVESHLKRPEGVSVGTQTNPRKADKIQSITYIKSFADWTAVADLQWEKELLDSVKIIEGGNIFETEGEAVKLCWTSPGEDLQGSRLKQWNDRYPELMEASGDFEVLERTSKLRVGEAKFAQKTLKIVHIGSEQEAWEKLVRASEEMDGRSKIVMNEIPGMPLQRGRKLVAWAFSGKKLETVIFTSRPKRNAPQPTDRTLPKSSRNTYALVVEEKGRPFKEILERVKPVLKDTAMASSIKGLRSSREGGKLIISVEKDEESLNKIKDMIGSINNNMEIRALGDARKVLKQLHIRGMDVLTGKDEVLAAVEGKVGSLAGKNFRFSDMRPNINNTRAITIWLERPLADLLLDADPLRVGMVNCRVEERISLTRCRRCWAYGHTAKTCSGTDLAKACFKCGQEGHVAKTCDREEECPLCHVRGHRADTGKCKFFQKALAEARKN